MPPQRHSDDLVLAAARAAILDIGLRRTTLAEVARRAGVSRMTLYRQYGDLDAIVSALLTAEFVAVFDRVHAETGDAEHGRRQVAQAVTRTVAAIADHPLYQRILAVDPELLLPLIVDRVGSTQRIALRLLASLIERGQEDGSVRAMDPELAASVIGTAAQSFVFSARVIATQHKPDVIAGELEHLIEGYLTPALTPAPTPAPTDGTRPKPGRP
ncbi:MAG: TetR/AcrR family transcriptional regulator [Mycobacteriales bacterium]